MEISARNQLRGTVKALHFDGVMAEVVVDVGGQQIVSVITATSAKHLGLAVGDSVVALMKSTEVMIGK
jgi:molybdopterin-binding protein